MTQSAIALTLGNFTIRQHNGLFSLNDLHQAAGSERRHQPSNFLAIEQTQALIAEIKSADSQNCLESRRGNNGGTYACRELVIAYAAWISAAFHLKVIRVFLAATQPQAGPAIAYDRISPAQAQDLKEIVAAIVQAGIQGYGETWARLQRKFRVNSYLELPATRHLEARAYLLGKLPKAVAGNVVDEAPTPAPTMFGRQWLVSTDMNGKETVRPVAPDQFVKSFREIARGIAVGDMELSTAELIDLASACNQRLVHRLGNPALVLAV